MRAAMIAMLILLLPAALFAGPSMGVYFTYTPAQMHYSPVQFEEFNGYIFAQGAEGCLLTGVEFRVQMPSGISIDSFTVADGGLSMGSPASGISVAFWPPLDGSYPGYNLIGTLHLFASRGCVGTNPIKDAPMRILAHPESGHIYGSCLPDNELFDFAGLTSIICPELVGTEDKSWGAIKSLF